MARTVRRLRGWQGLVLLAGMQGGVAWGEVTFYVQREGSTDTGAAQFATQVGVADHLDFDGAGDQRDGTPVTSLPLTNGRLSLEGQWTNSFTPYTFSSTEFSSPGQVFGRAIFVGHHCVMRPSPDTALWAMGFWVFDDGNKADSVYRLEVVETDGARAEMVLRNDLPLDEYGYEVEGFVGVVSAKGIAEISVTALDATSGVDVGDGFEIDTLTVLATSLGVPPPPQVLPPPPPPPLETPPPTTQPDDGGVDSGSGGDVDDDDDEGPVNPPSHGNCHDSHPRCHPRPPCRGHVPSHCAKPEPKPGPQPKPASNCRPRDGRR